MRHGSRQSEDEPMERVRTPIVNMALQTRRCAVSLNEFSANG